MIFFNHVLAPLLGKWITIPTLDLPAWYANLAGTIVLGLFGKKAWDSTDIHWNGQTVKPAKEKVKAEIAGIEVGPESPAKRDKKTAAEMTPEEIDARLVAICKEKGIEP